APRRLYELQRVRIQRLEIPPLPLREQDVERDRALPAPADARDHRELVARNREIDIPQVVLPRPPNLDRIPRRQRRSRRGRKGRRLRNRISRSTPIALTTELCGRRHP